MRRKPFPPADHEQIDPYQLLAKHLDCPQDVIETAAEGLQPPEWLSADNLEAVRIATKSYNRAVLLATDLINELERFRQDEIEELRMCGCITVEQLTHLRDRLASDCEQGEQFLDSYPRQGGKRLDAHQIARIVARAFGILERPVTFGQFNGSPSTEYGRAVEYALSIFGIRSADWRRPAQAARTELQDERVRAALDQCQLKSKD